MRRETVKNGRHGITSHSHPFYMNARTNADYIVATHPSPNTSVQKILWDCGKDNNPKRQFNFTKYEIGPQILH
jgi:hypothetical protein